MNPRSFLNFFKTGSGRLLLFGVVFAGGLMLLAALRHRNGATPNWKWFASRSETNRTDKPQVVETVHRPMEVFRPAPPQPEPQARPTNDPPRKAEPETRNQEPPVLPPISLFADSTAGQSEPKALGSIYAP